MSIKKIFKTAAIALSFAVACTSGVMAADWPSKKPVRMIVPYGAGGMLDSVARIIANGLQEKYGQTFVVENIGGASGTIGSAQVAKADGDGYTLLFTSPGPSANAVNVFPDLPYKPLEDFSNITRLYEIPLAMMASSDLGVTNLKELIEYAKANPNKVAAGHPGAGLYGHLALLAVAETSGIKINLVPYRNATTSILSDLLAGNIQIAVDVIGKYIPSAEDGKLVILGVASEKRIPQMPDVATFIEQGVDLNAAAWMGLQGPAGIDAKIIEQINADVKHILMNDERVTNALKGATATAMPNTPAEFSQLIVDTEAQWRPIIKKFGLQSK